MIYSKQFTLDQLAPIAVYSKIKDMFSSEYADFDYDKLYTFILDRINQYYKVNPSVIKAVVSANDLDLCTIDAKVKALDKKDR